MRGTAPNSVIALALVIACATEGQTTERFEVASVRVSPSSSAGKPSWSDSGGTTFTATNIPLKILVQMAYEVDEKQIFREGLLGSEQYDVAARPEGGTLTSERLKSMLVSLLAERFGLVTHRETKTVSGYALVKGKDGAKLHASEASRAGQAATFRGRIIGRATDMVVLASMLGRPLGAPVVDRTGMKGTFDFDLSFAPPESADSSLPSIFNRSTGTTGSEARIQESAPTDAGNRQVSASAHRELS